MSQRNRKTLATALLCANLLFIWGNSLLPASVSATISGWVKQLLELLLGAPETPADGHGLLRKLAHFLEFASLGLLLGWRISMDRQNKWILPTALSGVSVACVDELLQHFSPGRAPGILDVGIDSAGILLGMSLLILGKHITKKQLNGG